MIAHVMLISDIPVLWHSEAFPWPVCVCVEDLRFPPTVHRRAGHVACQCGCLFVSICQPCTRLVSLPNVNEGVFFCPGWWENTKILYQLNQLVAKQKHHHPIWNFIMGFMWHFSSSSSSKVQERNKTMSSYRPVVYCLGHLFSKYVNHNLAPASYCWSQ